MRPRPFLISVALIALFAASSTAFAQNDPDEALSLAQPDFNLVALPTTLRLPRHKSAFRVTHRFTRPLGNGNFGDLASDFFGIDTGAQIGLEYRFGLFRGTEIGIHRTSDRIIEFFAQHEVKAQSDRFPFTVDALGTIEGTDNFSDSYTPSLGAVISRNIVDRAALYIEPIWVNNVSLLPKELVDHNDSFLLGLGARLRIRPTVYITLEGSPRVSGYDEGVSQISVAIDKRVGGHLFQLNFSNNIGTTMGQIARGGLTNDNWFMGFNISRKFY